MLIDIINLLKEIGYPFLFLWSIFEGEIGLILAGWLSSENIFEFQKVIFISLSGAMMGDIVVFSIGRFYSTRAKTLIDENKKIKIQKWIKKYGVFLLVFERFIYGTHIPVLLTFGFSKYDIKKWIIFDFIGVVLWALTFTFIGYFFGKNVIETILFFQKQILIVILVMIFIYWYNNKKTFKDKNE